MRYHSNSDLGKAYEAGYVDGRAAAQAAMPPRELTQAMLDAGSLVFVRKRQDYIPKWEPSIAGDFWRAMYDAWAQEQTSGAASAVTDGPAADPLPVAWATPSLLVTMSAVEKRLLTSPEMRGRGAGWEADARDADRYSVPLYRAAALDRLRAERDDWKRLAENWTACADAAQQPPEFYEKYNEGTMRAMQALLTRERTEGAALRTERDALRECVRAADAMALECRRVGLISSTWLEDYDDARAKVKP